MQTVQASGYATSPSFGAWEAIPETDVDVILTGLYEERQVVPAGQVWEVLGTAEFDNVNLRVEGTLRMRPGATLRFINVDESAYVGGGMDEVPFDVGLWVMGDGALDIQGTPKVGWDNDGSDPSWQPGDELVLAPTAAGSYQNGFTPYAGGAVPTVNGWPTEVINLTRDVVIEGTLGGRAHIFIRSTQPHTIKHCAIRHMGPRQPSGQFTTKVLGRYGLHLHHCMTDSAGTLVEGVVIRDCGNHSFVPHMSHGITLRDCVAHDVMENAYWWDFADISDDTIIEHCIAAGVTGDPDTSTQRLNGFSLGKGERNEVNNCVAVGVSGGKNSAGFHWPEHAGASWGFHGNVAHNCRHMGIVVWQNNVHLHNVTDFVAYRCGEYGIMQGAYVSPTWHYDGVEIFECVLGGIEQHSLHGPDPTLIRPDGYGMSFEHITVTAGKRAVAFSGHSLPTTLPTLYKDCSFAGQSEIPIRVHETQGGNPNPGLHDFVDCGLQPAHVEIVSTHPGFRLRAQDGGEAWSMDETGAVTSIPPFYGSPPPPPPWPTIIGGYGPDADNSAYFPPAIPEPAVGETFTDPVFGARVTRYTPGGSLWEYAQMSWWSLLSTHTIMARVGGGFQIVTFPGGTHVRNIFFGEPRWSRTNNDWIYYYAGTQVRRYSVSTEADVLIRDFAGTYSTIGFGGGQNDVSDNDRINVIGDGRYVHVIDLLAGGNDWGVFDLGPGGYDYVCLAMDGETYAVGGPSVLRQVSRDGLFMTQLLGTFPHLAMARETDGTPVVIVSTSNAPNEPPPPNFDWNGIAKISLDGNATQTLLIGLIETGGYFNAMHFAGTLGKVYVSTYHWPGEPSEAEWAGYTDELFSCGLVHGQDHRDSRIERIAHTHTSASNYWGLPFPTVSQDRRFVGINTDWHDGARDIFGTYACYIDLEASGA